MFLIQNDGPDIQQTDYWATEAACAGYAYLSWNAVAARRLLPPAMASAIVEMQTAKMVIISRGPWKAIGGQIALELLFEDHSDEPYCITLLETQTDRHLPDDNQGGGFSFIVWTSEGKVLTLPAKFRTVPTLPCMGAWTEH